MNSQQIVANGWRAELPSDWEDRSMITLVGETDRDGFASNIVITREEADSGTSVEYYARRQAEMMRAEIEELQILDERAVEINGLPGFQRLQRFAANNLSVQQVQTFIFANGVVYAITGTSSVEAFDRAIPAFKQFVETFRPNPQ